MKYIFIDSNQYRHLFSEKEGFSENIYMLLINLINKKHVQLLLPQQVKDEVERNRFRKWPEGEIAAIDKCVTKLEAQIKKVAENFPDSSTQYNISREIKKAIVKANKRKERVRKMFMSNRSKANQRLNKLFDRAQHIGETDELIKQAEIRQKKGNPPYNTGTIGDQLIWESLLHYISSQASDKKLTLIFVANDSNAWGSDAFDKWLQIEFRERTRGIITYSKKLSDISELTKDEQARIRSEEEANLRRNTITDWFSNSKYIGMNDISNMSGLRSALTASVPKFEVSHMNLNDIISPTGILNFPECDRCGAAVFSLSPHIRGGNFCSTCQTRIILDSRTCIKCGTSYYPSPLTSSVTDLNLCETCRGDSRYA